MSFMLPCYVVSFRAEDVRDCFTPCSIKWRVDGDAALDALCKTLRTNGITTYKVRPHVFSTPPVTT
jgi:hypothetical protein